MNRWLILLIAMLPHCTGCLAYAYPQVVYVPELTVPNPDGSVHAYRVDIDQTLREPKPALLEYTLANIKVDSRGQIASQLEVAPATGVLNPLKIADAGHHERSQYTMFVRLYRPGYGTQEVKAGDKKQNLIWIKAEGLEAQEKAIDDLLAIPSTPDNPAKGTWWDLASKGPKTSPPALGLQPGSASSSHQIALKFAAGEYQRLANLPGASAAAAQTTRDRLRAKAVWLNSYADQPLRQQAVAVVHP